MTLEEFLVQTQGDVRKLVSDRMAEGGYLKAEAAFTDVVMQHLSECGMTFDTRPLHIERKISGAMLKLNGYAVSDDADQLDLFVTLYADTDTVQNIPDAEVVKAAEQCLRFLGEAADGTLANAIDPSDDAYELCLTIRDCYAELEQIRVYIITDRQTKTKSFKSKDQFAPQLIELARCIREDREPEPNGYEGLADVRIVEALYRSAIERRPIEISPVRKRNRPDMSQEIHRPAVRKSKLVDVASPSGD